MEIKKPASGPESGRNVAKPQEYPSFSTKRKERSGRLEPTSAAGLTRGTNTETATAPVFLPGGSHGQRSLVAPVHGVADEPDRTEALNKTQVRLRLMVCSASPSPETSLRN